MTTKQPTAVAIYARKSNKTDSDDKDGRSASVRTQLRKCHEHAEAHGWPVVAEYEDNGISAVPGAKRRDDFERLLADAAAGKFDTVVIYKTDRLERDPAANERIIDVFRQSRVRVYALDSGWADPSRSGDRTNMRFRSVIGVTEVENLSDRLKVRAEQRATVEWRLVAGVRPFGWRWRKPCGPGPDCYHRTKCTEPGKRPQQGTRAGLELDPVEAPALAQAYADVAEGLTLYAAHKRLAERVDVGKMTASTLGTILRNPRNAGLVTYKGEIVGEAADGQQIVDRALFDKVAGILGKEDRRTSPGRPANTWLGGGVLVCGKCGGPMSASNRHSGHGDGKKAKVYICSRNRHLTRRRATVDDMVLPVIADVLEELAQRGKLTQTPAEDAHATELQQQIDTLTQRLDEMAGLAASGVMTPVDFANAATIVRGDVANLKRELAARSNRPALTALSDETDVRAVWDGLLADGDTQRVRSILYDLAENVTANTDRSVTINWRAYVGLEPTVLAAPEPAIDGRGQRRQQVADLHAKGLTISAIATEMGCDRATVRADLKVQGLYEQSA